MSLIADIDAGGIHYPKQSNKDILDRLMNGCSYSNVIRRKKMSLTDFWKSLTPEEKEKLRPYVLAENAAMLNELVRNKVFYRWPKGKKNEGRRGTLV